MSDMCLVTIEMTGCVECIGYQTNTSVQVRYILPVYEVRITIAFFLSKQIRRKQFHSDHKHNYLKFIAIFPLVIKKVMSRSLGYFLQSYTYMVLSLKSWSIPLVSSDLCVKFFLPNRRYPSTVRSQSKNLPRSVLWKRIQKQWELWKPQWTHWKYRHKKTRAMVCTLYL